MQGVAMSWLYMVGQDCAGSNFFAKSGTLNEVIGTVVLAPLLRPLCVLRDRTNESRAMLHQLVSSVVGGSVSHLAVFVFLLVTVPFLYVKFGLMGILKYWLIPLTFAHVNAGSFLKHKPAGAFLFPELGSGEHIMAPMYALEAWAAQVKALQPSEWQSPLWLATRELLMWRRRDWLLHGALLVGGLFSILSVTQAWAWALPLLVIPLLAWQSGAAHALGLLKEKTGPDAKPTSSLATGEANTSTTYTPQELWAHPELAAVDDIVFDIVKLAAVHPGGEQIRACGGTDVTGLFGSMHALTATRNRKVLLEYRVGTYVRDADAPRFNLDTQFARDAKAAIVKAMRGVDFYAPTGWWIRTGLMAVLTLTAETCWALGGRWYMAAAVGVLHALIGIAVQHDGSHGAVSRKPWINSLISHGADWIGSSRWLWFQQHVVGHHPHCNIEDVDPDAHSAEPLLQFHWLGNGKLVEGFRGWLLAHQHWYMYLVLPWYGPSVIYNLPQLVTMDHGGEVPIGSWLMSKRPTAVLMRVFYWLRIVAAPILLSGVSWPMALLGVPLVTGAVLTFVFLVSHNFVGSDRSPLAPKGEETDFYKLQVETSCSYGGVLSTFFTGGLNMQIEHHVMPRLNSWHYPRVQAALREVCEKHGVRYTYFPTLWDNVLDCITYMRDAGRNASSYGKQEAEEATSTKTTAQPLKIILNGRLLDVTRWAERHPGGDAVMRVFADRDATDQFYAMHSKVAVRKMEAMLSGGRKVEPEVKPSAATIAYRKLRDELKAEGMFESNKLHDLWVLVSNLSWYVVGWVLMRNTEWAWTGAMLFAWGMQQSGWLSHDYLHHGVYEDVQSNEFFGTIIGWIQGYDTAWWKDRHNLHHVATNEEGNDPDIDLAPVLTFVNQHVSLNVVQRFQHIYFIPILSLLHFSWMFSSFRFTVERRKYVRMVALLAYHYLVAAYVYRSPAGLFLWAPFFGSYLMKGFFTSIFVFSTHYPETRLPGGAREMSLLEQTALTSRNIGGGAFVDWMSGGIARQIEHHLFPMLPRARLPEIAPRVRKLCLEQGLPYHETSIVDCMHANVECLLWKRHIAAE